MEIKVREKGESGRDQASGFEDGGCGHGPVSSRQTLEARTSKEMNSPCNLQKGRSLVTP